ncbi:MAG TPA: sigma-70 family RNA polymerase sigma factor [Oligoflexia bacterium]|nr:sigma-70 family RNA polymerase sigma factor [Oligoflexia bacterium]HMP48479.1 sigma-70 family RNA polymerase sigma factor [Oligoflexia bacterium]
MSGVAKENTVQSGTQFDTQSDTEEFNRLSMNPEEWLQEYGDYLYRYAVLQLKDTGAAEDAVQDALMSAYRARESFQGKSTQKTWLMTILRNKVIDIARKRKRDMLVMTESIEDDPLVRASFSGAGIWSKWLNSWGSSPEDLLSHRDFLEQVNSCLEKLPDNLRQVFVLRNVDDLSTEEICERLDINANNVWVILYRARLRLRECLELNWFKVK